MVNHFPDKWWLVDEYFTCQRDPHFGWPKPKVIADSIPSPFPWDISIIWGGPWTTILYRIENLWKLDMEVLPSASENCPLGIMVQGAPMASQFPHFLNPNSLAFSNQGMEQQWSLKTSGPPGCPAQPLQMEITWDHKSKAHGAQICKWIM